MTARELILDAELRFSAADIVFGHGTDNARDEAVFLVFHALGFPFDAKGQLLDQELTEVQRTAVEAIVTERISSRRPAAYLTNRMWFAGHEFYIDERVLVPRSPIAELISARFEPWLASKRIYRILEIGTGSGCIAIATAIALPNAVLVATENSVTALEVAAINLKQYPQLGGRLRFIQADLFPAKGPPYDLIIANPPYVPIDVAASLPPEYQHEPKVALEAGPDGLKYVRRIIQNAPDHLSADGVIIVDVGEMADVVDHNFSSVSFTWIDLEYGGEGVGIAYKHDFRN